jgi:hypothetical protein
MLQKQKYKTSDQYLNELRDAFNHVVLKASSNDRYMYETLISEFPELKNQVLIYDVDGIGISFPPVSGLKWRSVADVYYHYLPEINRRREYQSYEKELNNYIDDKSDLSNDSGMES